MTDQDKIIALAKLDGWELKPDEEGDRLLSIYKDGQYCQSISLERKAVWVASKSKYLTSYDAIIPLIQKQDDETLLKMEKAYSRSTKFAYGLLSQAPYELADELLKAKGLL